jgi:hypothetical protein
VQYLQVDDVAAIQNCQVDCLTGALAQVGHEGHRDFAQGPLVAHTLS